MDFHIIMVPFFIQIHEHLLRLFPEKDDRPNLLQFQDQGFSTQTNTKCF